MKIGGIQKLTLLDYPGQVACILFTSGCNMQCPFCHNASLAENREKELDLQEVMNYLNARKGLLDGLVISGGEPLLHPDLRELIREARALGYLIKLDTNGSFPQQLERLLAEDLLDYVAMDIKHSRERYGRAIGTDVQALLPKIDRSVQIIRESKIPFEFRTTLVKGIHQEEDMEAIGRWITGSQPYYLQSYVNSGDVIQPKGLAAFSEEELERFLVRARRYCPNAQIRK